jgi:hypothetical protein
MTLCTRGDCIKTIAYARKTVLRKGNGIEATNKYRNSGWRLLPQRGCVAVCLRLEALAGRGSELENKFRIHLQHVTVTTMPED